MSRMPHGKKVSTVQREDPRYDSPLCKKLHRGTLPLCLGLISSVCGLLLLSREVYGQSSVDTEDKISITTNERGFTQLDSPQMTLITDVPLDDEIKNWPELLRQSVQQWAIYFDVPVSRMEQWRPTVYLIADRNRFLSAGYLDSVPPFSDGQQVGEQFFLVEQPSVYYRRHLFLHEATHWIMYKLYGGAGSPWFMEGMAEAQGTHRLSDNKLELRYIPKSISEVPYWGRLRLVSESLENNAAPSLSEILNFDTGYQDRMLRYSWSWMAVVFFDNHPKFGPILRKLSRERLDYSMRLSKEFKRELQPHWEQVVADWNAFVGDMDFGFDPARSLVSIDWNSFKPFDGKPTQISVDSGRGWQSAGLKLSAGDKLSITASGKYVLRTLNNNDKTIVRSDAAGVTYDYYRGKPIGQLVAAIVPMASDDQSKPWETISVGNHSTMIVPRDGVLMLKINEPAGQLFDNDGTLEVEIGPSKE